MTRPDQLERRTVSDEEIAEIRKNFRGPLFRPGEPGYDPGDGEGRQGEHYGKFLWNGRFATARPALVARPSTAADVVALVNFAREGGWHPSVRGGGHNTGGPAEADNDLVIDLSLMRNVRVDPVKRTARAGGGASWWDLDRNTQIFGLACVGGAIGHTGVAGLALGGGHGKLTRKYGMTVDNLLSADVVTADGTVHCVDADTEPDLFWAIRGGGGNFGVVTSLEFALHPVGPVWLDMNWWPVDETEEVLRFWRDWVKQQPPEMATSSIVVNAPDNRGFAPDIVGKRFVVITNLWHGPIEEGAEATRAIREFSKPTISISRQLGYAEVQTMNDGIANADYGFRNYTKTGYLKEFTDKAVATHASWSARQRSNDGLVEIIAIDGPMNAVAPDATALGARTAHFNHIISAGWRDEAEDTEQIQWVADFHSAMGAHYDGGVYVNYLDRGEPLSVIEQVYGLENFARLRQLKAQYDPTNLFRRNQNIPPADGASE